MPSSYTASARYNLQATGENVNVWGTVINTGALVLIDFNVNGWTTKALATDYSLTSVNGAADEARSAMLKFTGTGAFTVTIPAVSKGYSIWNACTGVLTVTNGSASATVQPGEKVAVMNDGGANMARVQPTDFGGARVTSVGTPTSNSDAATKLYADNLAFTANAGILPGQGGNAGKFLTTNGTVAAWSDAFASPTITTPAITTPTITGGATISGGATLTGSAKQNVQAVAAASIDLSASDFFTKSISTNTPFTFDGATASKAQAFALELTISSAAVPTWPASVKWPSAAAPTLGNGTHILGFMTFDGGSNWIGVLAAFNVS